ncbi:PERF protein, partial [Chordeiles acutipennis]|nr:PERF protein [Chordeiles acutipennis]
TPRRPFSIFILLLSHHLLFFSSVSPQCHRARGPTCLATPLTPGTQLLGWGFDVTTLNPTTGQVLLLGDLSTAREATCVLCPDLLAGGQPRRLPPGVAGWRSGRRCHQGTRVATGGQAVGTMVAGVEKVAKGWRVGLAGVVAPPQGQGRLVVAGSHSRVAEFGLQRQREDRYGFASLELRCVLYWSRLSPHLHPSPHFLRALRSLPPKFTSATAPDYAQLLASYGTHVILGSQTGGLLRSLTAVRSCRAAMMASSVQEVADCLGVEVTAGGGPWRSSLLAKACQKARATHQANVTFNEAFSERLVEVEGGEEHGDLLYGRVELYTKWLQSLLLNPGLVLADVRPLHLLLPRGDPRRSSLRAAIGHFITWRSLRLHCNQSCPLAAGGHLVPPCQCSCSTNAVVNADCCSRARGLARLMVMVDSGWGWLGDHFSMTDSYVRVIFGRRQVQTSTLWNTNRPKWRARLDFGVVELRPNVGLKVEVWDEDNGWDDDLLGVCEEPVEAGGERRVICFPGGGHLQFSYQLTCGPSLGGPLCHDYVPQAPQGDDGGFSR